MKTLASLTLAIAACSAPKPQPPPSANCGLDATSTGVSADNYFQKIGAIVCNPSVSCAEASACYSVVACAKAMAQSEIVKSVAAGRIQLQADNAAACLNALAARTITCQPYFDPPPAVCWSALKGTVAVDAACFIDADCASGSCDATAKTCPGKCRATLGEGAACGDNGSFCNPQTGLSCLGKVCTAPTDLPRGKASDPCGVFSDCESGMACLQGACAAPATAGGDCILDSDCQPTLYCLFSLQGGDHGSCTARIAENGVCGEDPTHKNVAILGSECTPGLVCKGFTYDYANNPQVAGACAVPGDEGAACIARPPTERRIIVSGCKAGLQCLGGACAKPPSTGSCGQGNACLTSESYCDTSSHVCTARKVAGLGCGDKDQCLSGMCTNGACGEIVSVCHPN